MCDCIIVGSGFCGSVIARRLAEEHNKKVVILERRNHIAGNMYDELDSNNILYQKYGPHIFHTNRHDVYSWLIQYGEWEPFKLRCMVDMDGVIVPSPFNFKAIDMMYPKDEAEKIKQELNNYYSERKKVTIVEMLECENPIIKSYAEMLFEIDYRPYTSKQWGIPPEEIDINVLKRVPVLLSYQDAYFDDIYQIMPKGGFTNFFSKLLDHPNITVILNSDAISIIKIDINSKKLILKDYPDGIPVIYTGAIDELLNYKHGYLPYRSLRFEYQTVKINSFQDAPVVAYPKAEGYTRITEYKKLPPQEVDGVTVVALEYPLPYNESNEPYYPIPTDANFLLHQLYLKELQDINNLYLCGRLADYKYYNMDDAIVRAFDVYKEII